MRFCVRANNRWWWGSLLSVALLLMEWITECHCQNSWTLFCYFEYNWSHTFRSYTWLITVYWRNMKKFNKIIETIISSIIDKLCKKIQSNSRISIQGSLIVIESWTKRHRLIVRMLISERHTTGPLKEIYLQLAGTWHEPRVHKARATSSRSYPRRTELTLMYANLPHPPPLHKTTTMPLWNFCARS